MLVTVSEDMGKRGRSRHTSVCLGLLFIITSVGSLLLGFSENCGLNDIASSQPLQFSKSTLSLNLLAKFFVADLSSTASFDLGNANISVEDSLTCSKSRFCGCLLTVSDSFLNRCLGVDLCDLSVLLTDSLGFSYITFALGLGDVDTSLIDSTLMCLARKRLEVV